MLSACAQPESSAARHAKHLSYASDDNFAPHYRTKLYDSYQSSIPFLQQFWELGKKIAPPRSLRLSSSSASTNLKARRFSPE
ncbi:Exc2 family lipoprotein [Edwardsiella anguillarum]|nr:Exc2 family lipoprotein [Edwardsiella anguillarum]